ncbi:hypothetical protein BJ508DRAFT_39385 [Ascobolus immersus RN42]|uniref:Uncharacterized protein n=1 Tax=Ascobolus immersus RN42 TaxID=1160509 RepID=A0A3N4HM06_ASCIM|nr:hypothetical protein BJ508DRAFT_39385 [Ascobolus immersus RN42]
MLKYASSYRWGKYYNTMVKKKDALTTPLVNSPHAEYFLDSTVLSRTRNGFIFRVVKDRILPESGIQEIIEAEWQALAKKADEAIAVCQLGVDLG